MRDNIDLNKNFFYYIKTIPVKPLMVFGAMGFLLRIIFIPFTMHQDMLWVHMGASKMAYHGVFNIYDYVKINFHDLIVKQGTNYYPPLSYFLLGGYHLIVKSVIPGLGSWLDRYSQMVSLCDTSRYFELFKIPFGQLCLFIFFMKLPYLIFDMLCGLLLLAFFNKAESSIRAFKFWMINPVVIFGSYIFGQFDIALALFLLLALFTIKRGNIYLGIFLVGCSSLLKSAPLILIPPLSLIMGDSIKKIIRLIAAAILPIVVAMAPFYFLTGNYMLTTIFPKFICGDGAKLIDSVEFLIGKLVFIAGYIFILYRLVFKKDIKYNSCFDGWRYITATLLLSYFIIYTPIHHFQWVIPFLIIGVINNNIPKSIYIFQIVCLFVYAICSRSLSAHLFLPLNPEYFYNLKSLPEYMNQFMKWGIVMRVARSLFYSCSLYIIWKIIFKPEVKNA